MRRRIAYGLVFLGVAAAGSDARADDGASDRCTCAAAAPAAASASEAWEPVLVAGEGSGGNAQPQKDKQKEKPKRRPKKFIREGRYLKRKYGR